MKFEEAHQLRRGLFGGGTFEGYSYCVWCGLFLILLNIFDAQQYCAMETMLPPYFPILSHGFARFAFPTTATIIIAIFGVTTFLLANFSQSHCVVTAICQVSLLAAIMLPRDAQCYSPFLFLLADFNFLFSLFTLDCCYFPFCSRFACRSLLGMDHQMDDRCLGGLLD